MNQETRIQKIQDIINQGNPYGRQEIPWKDKLESFDVHKIPLDYLVYNKYNGRILSSAISLEKQGHIIDPETEEGKVLIEKLLWESKIKANTETYKSIQKIGQEKVGIITKDGIIIDGNRRAMLLNKAGKGYFKAIILPITISDDRNAIEELETRHQMGEDKKLDYNPIEKYLKAWNLKNRGISINDIAEWMGETTSEIEKLIGIKELIDEYLEYLEYDGIYTSIHSGQEDLFISLYGWTRTFYGANSNKGFDGYTDADVDDLKFIAFDYIRVVYGTEDKRFRKFANGLKNKHLFGDKEIWNSFAHTHFDGIKEFTDQERKIDLSSEDLKSHIQSRDIFFREIAYEFLDKNFTNHTDRIDDNIHKDKPFEMANKSLNKLKNISPNRKIDTSTINVISEIYTDSKKILGKQSPMVVLKGILTDLKRLDFDNLGDQHEEILSLVREINHITYEIKKDLGA